MADRKRTMYRLLLKLYPARFREEYETPMERQFLDDYGEARGALARTMVWLRTLMDLATSIPKQALFELRQDLQYTLRVHRRSPFATVLAFAALALAIGATTGVFSVLNALLLRSLPFRDPGRLVELSYPPVNVLSGRTAFFDWRDHSRYLEDAAGFTSNEMNLSTARDSVRARVTETTSNFFRVLGSEPWFGRGYWAAEDIVGRNGIAVIGYGLWQQFFGGDPRVLGSTIWLNGASATVVGVAPRGFDYPASTSVWTPTVFDLGRIPKTAAFGSQTIGRLKRSVTMAQAASMFGWEARRANAGMPEVRPTLFSLRDRLAGPVRQASVVLMGIVAFVLLVACANLAHLLLSRATERRNELAVRAALGASRARLVQQLITEAIVLTLLAAAGGLAVAHWASRLVASVQPAQLSTQQYTILDWRVIGFALVVALLTGVVFGVFPACQIGRMQPARDVIRNQPGSRVWSTGLMRSTLVASQAALTVVLVAGAFSMGRTFLRVIGMDLGYRADHLVTLNVSLAGTRYASGDLEKQYYGEAIRRLRTLPGVESAAAVSYLPLMKTTMFQGGVLKLDSGEKGPPALFIAATPEYFRTMGTRVLQGREFNAVDRAGADRVAIVSEKFARGFGAQRLVGRKLNLAGSGKPRLATIVGVFQSQRYSGYEEEGPALLFLPIEQSLPDFVTFVARVKGNPEQFLAVCRDAIRQVDPQVPVYDVKTLDQRLRDNLARPRFYTTAILFLSAFAVLLAVVGIYGVAAHSIAQRTHEIGVRIAVGASPLHVRLLLLRQSLLPLTAGVAAGVAGAAVLGRYLRYLMASAEPVGTWTCAAAALLLASTAAIAVWTATSRILRIDPMSALRAE